MTNTRVKISSIVQNQLPDFVQEEYPLVSEFLKEYYNSLEGKSGTLDILQNIDQYVKIDNLSESLFSRTVTVNPQAPQTYFIVSGGYSIENLVVYKNGVKLTKNVDYFATDGSSVFLTSPALSTDVIEFAIQTPSSTFLSSSVDFVDSTINVSSTYGFPESNGIIRIDSEIILYKNKTTTSFLDCTRGFSGITSYRSENNPDQLVFSTSGISTHTINTKVENLSSLLLKEFLVKIKRQLIPGFENREFTEGLNEKTFIKQAKDFYTSKGTDQSYTLLFKSLFGETVDVIKPRDFLLKPSDAQYRITKDLVVESISGDPMDLENRTLYQDASEDNFFSKSYGTITKVEKIVRQNKTYYVLSLDSDYNKDLLVDGSVYGNFPIHPSTKLTIQSSLTSTLLDVDSTIGFPSSGKLLFNINGVDYTLNYSYKNLTQFNLQSACNLVIPAGTDLKLNDAYAYSKVGDTLVKVRITGVLSDISFPDLNYLMSKGDPIKAVTLGYEASGKLANNWIFNIPNKYDLKEVKGPNSSNTSLNLFSYEFITYDSHSINLGDSVTLISSDSTKSNFKVVRINNQNSISAEGPKIDNINLKYSLERNIKKPNFTNFISLNEYTPNVQNVYLKDENNIYVASNGIPDYLGENIEIKSTDIVFSGTFSGETLDLSSGIPNNLHGLYTGDSITYIKNTFDIGNTLDIISKTYYVKKIDETKIKLANSKSDLYSNKFVSVSGTVVNNTFKKIKFESSNLSPQHYIKNIASPKPTSIGENLDTPIGPVGLLINGIEVYSYKSEDKIYYGGIQNVEVLDGGVDYDVINPPSILIEDVRGSNASVLSQVKGSLERIDVVDGGFDYLDEPIITITGGNGSGAYAKPNLTTFKHQVSFNSIQSAGLVNLTNNTIGFSSYHKFRDYERVVYLTEGQTGVGGISTNAQYYVNVQNEFNVKLHKTLDDAVSGINTINLTSYGVGVHLFESYFPKRKISSISVLNKGNGYQNKKTVCTSSGINTAYDSIIIPNHGYNTGEIIVYKPTGSAVGGLSTNSSYFVTKIDDNQFKLSQVGIATTNRDFYFKTNQYVNLTSVGSSSHTFNYPEIVVSVSGRIGVSTLVNQNFNAILQPVFRGSIENVFVTNSGVGYGSSEIINYERQPVITLETGSGAQLSAIVNAGKIKQILVLNGGNNYTSVPTINTLGIGTAAILTPVISGGKIVDVKIVNGGVGFSTVGTLLEVVPGGRNFKSQCKIKSWTINKVEKHFNSNSIQDDDGVIDVSPFTSNGSQYCHLYAPRKLRRSVFGIDYVNGRQTFVPDLTLSANREVTSNIHSPIIGWAYDGNPIYGPYGYSNPSGGTVREMISGYISQISPERPNPISSSGQTIYPEGFFVEDYRFNNSGDLDEHNGRFCITPEFPNGIYAYFATINNGSTETSGVFKNYKKPVFPYLIGNTFKSSPNQFNYTRIKQDDFDFVAQDLIRNTTPYNLTSKNSQYEFLLNPIKIKEPISKIKSISSGGVNDIGITTGGSNYKVGDNIVFNNLKTNGSNAYAQVSHVKGKEVKTVSFASTFSLDVEFYPVDNTGKYIGFCSSPHSLSNNDVISISGISTLSKLFDRFYQVGVRTDTLSLLNTVGTSTATGIITYFSVNGSLNYPSIRENDVYRIEDEKVKVLSIDKPSSRIKVLRAYDSTVGSSHSASTVLYEQTRKFTFDSPGTTNVVFNLNKEFYFNPVESLAIGSSFGVGIGYTLNFSNPGSGITSIFIPTKTIYLPSHSLNTGDKLIYSSNGGSPITVSNDGVSSFSLENNQSLYVAKVSDDLIGISTNKVGLGSTGSFVGIDSNVTFSTLYLTSVGSGLNHSFKTDYDNVLVGEFIRNTVTVVTASAHGLKNDDTVYFESLPGITTTVVIKYNDNNRRLIVNPKNFVSGDVDIANNTISISNHGYFTGQKVIYNSSTGVSVGGLNNDGIYYVVKFNKDKVKLSSTYYNATKDIPETIDFTATFDGSISLVNPTISIIPNQVINFDLSDKSLSFAKGSVLYPAFDFKLYTNSNLTEEFDKSEDSSGFDVIRSGKIGVDPSSSVKLSTSNINFDLYYALVPVELTDNYAVKKEIINDNENILDNNKLSLTRSFYTGNYTISGVGQTTFKFNILGYPESLSYTNSDGDFQYYTNSKNVSGTIQKLELKSTGSNYETSPGITSVFSQNGRNAILDPISISIGNINRIEIEDIGFEYPSDLTLRPSAKLPQVLKVNPLSTFKSVGVSSVGINYTLSPSLVVIDGYTNKVVTDVDLSYDIRTKTVTIVRNTEGINNVTPIIIPTNNSNGVPISNITFNSVTKDVTVQLGVNYSFGEIFPFNVGDRVLVESTSVGSATASKGYNSKNYNYKLFTLTSVNPQYGGSGATIVYNLSEYLSGSESPGSFDFENSAGVVVPEKYFPVFNTLLEKGRFIVGEKVRSDSFVGTVLNWNEYTEQLKISTTSSFRIDSQIIGETSKAKGSIVEVEDLNAIYTVGSSSIVRKGWNKETGFLNNQFQVTSDNNYYQNFSYSIKSKVDYETWNESIGNLNHTSGFKKFSDLTVESIDSQFVGISTSQNDGDFSAISDLVREIDLNCVNDFDLAREKTLEIDSEYYSKEIIFNSVSLQDELQSIGNRVLMIDDISDQFSNLPGSNNYANVDTFRLQNFRFKKYITFVRDKRFTGLRQISLVSILQDGLESYISEYSKVETGGDLGSFDFSIFGTEGTLKFFPSSYFINDYDISAMSYGIYKDSLGVGNTSLGNLVELKSSTATVPSGTTSQTTIVSIASTYRASKVLVQFEPSDGKYFQSDELTLLNDGTNVHILEYGKLSNLNRIKYIGDGIGTYTAYISGSNINLDFIPNVGLTTAYTVNTIRVSIANTSGAGIATGSIVFNTGSIKSNYVAISSSPTPSETIVSNYSSNYSSAYYLVMVEDVLNNSYQVSEVVVVDDETNVYPVEFGSLRTTSGLGTIGAGVGSTGTNLYFTPNPNISVNVKVYQHSMGIVDAGNSFESYGFVNASLDSSYSEYQGTLNKVKKSFDLKNKQTPIFQRVFDASNSIIVNVPDNLVRIPKHFYVTGEELIYNPGNGSPIGIATTTISGIGITDKLPSSVYAVKLNDLNIRFASSAENALKSIPQTLTITSVGIGTTHFLTAKKQNSKCLITIDNHIQSPIVSTLTTVSLAKTSVFNEINLTLSGISSIYGGDLLKINNEIVKVNVVGFGSTNVFLVDRGWMGTSPENHSIGSTVTKVIGNYNIIDNTIHFVEPPYGNSPIGTVTNRPDDRDYTGITTHSTFSGRVFLRSGLENESYEPYSRNYIFDGLSERFTGINTEFILKSDKSDITGVSTGSVILLINNIFQEPQRLGTINIPGNYKMSENAGITTLSFIGNISSTSYDINTASIPRGGVIVSVASTQGFGYQPLISAGGTSIVSTAGTISSISIGSTGSGYRGSSKYEIITQTSATIAAGSTIIPIDNQSGVFAKLQYSTSNKLGIGSAFQDVSIVGSGNAYVLIGSGSTSSQTIEAGTSVVVTLDSPTTGIVNVGVKTSSVSGVLNYQFVGFTTVSSGRISKNVIITNPGSGYTSSNPPLVIIDSPENYYNIPLVYSSGTSGIGTEATVNIVVGQGSSVIDFEVKNTGFAYKTSEVLTVQTGGLTGIPTDSSKPFRKFELTIDEVFSDLFSSWSVGDFQVIDKVEDLFNGRRRTFPIKINGVQTTIRAKAGSNIDVQSVLLIFVNDILQFPGEGYLFSGGSTITFTEPPKEGDTCKILFYKGTEIVDVVFVDILESLKIGDDVRLNDDRLLLKEDERLVTEVISSDSIETNPYSGFGLTLDETLSRPVIWCRQTEDKIIGGQEVGKSRELYEPLIQPTTNIIQNVGIASTVIFVQSVKVFFDDLRENSTAPFKTKITITSQDNLVGASATAIVSTAGTISSLSLNDGGLGFTTSPSVVIATTVGVATKATATASITSGIVTSLTITNPGSGYTTTNPPLVLIEYPALKQEKIEDVTYEGDFGTIVGISTTSVGIASTALVFDLFIPIDSYLRNTNINVGIATTGISGIKTDYYFTVFNSNIGFGVTSLDSSSSVVGVGTTCLDNVYKVASVSIAQTSVPGIGVTNVSRVIVSILNYNGLSGTGYSGFYGEFSWGKINAPTRKKPNSFVSYNNNGVSGILTSPIIQRINPLRYVGYSTSV